MIAFPAAVVAVAAYVALDSVLADVLGLFAGPTHFLEQFGAMWSTSLLGDVIFISLIPLLTS